MAAQTEKLARIGGWLAVIAIAVLSLIPGSLRPHTGAPGWLEHFMAYAGAAALMTFGYHARHYTVTLAFALSAYSGLLEVLQIFVPGRHAGLFDFVISSAGAASGAVLIWGLLKYLPRPFSS